MFSVFENSICQFAYQTLKEYVWYISQLDVLRERTMTTLWESFLDNITVLNSLKHFTIQDQINHFIAIYVQSHVIFETAG